MRVGTGCKERKKHRTMMGRPAALLLCSLLLLLGASARATDMDPVATVNGTRILRARLENAVQFYLQQRGADSQDSRNPAQVRRVERQVLDVLIGQELLWAEARVKNLVPPAAEVDQALARAKQRFPTPEAFQAEIARGGFTEESYAEDLKQQLAVRRLIQEEIASGVTVTDQEVDAFYRANLDQMRRPEEAHLRHLLVALDPGADEAAAKAARAKIERVLAEARGGADFAELAKTHSDDPSGPQGGDLGFVEREQLVTPFADAAFALQRGEISDVVRTQFGFHVIRLEERRGGDLVPQAEAAGRIRDHLVSAKVQQALQDRVARLRADAAVEIAELR